MSDPTRTAAPTADSQSLPALAPARAFSLKFSARDLMNIGIFVALYIVIVYVIGMLGIIGPVAMLVSLPVSAAIGGIPFMLFTTRIKHAGMLTVFGLVFSLLFMLTGHPWESVAFTVALAVVGEVILAAGKYRSKWAAILSYTVFSLWYFGPFIPMFRNREEYLNAPGMAEMGPDYIAQFDQIVSTPAVLGMTAAALVCGFLGALLGTALLSKHFRKAGLA